MLPHHRPRRTPRQPAGRLPNGSPALSTSATRSYLDFQFDKVEAIQSYSPVVIQVYEGRLWRVLPQRPDLTLAIVKDHGLETLDAYIARSTKVKTRIG